MYDSTNMQEVIGRVDDILDRCGCLSQSDYGNLRKGDDWYQVPQKLLAFDVQVPGLGGNFVLLQLPEKSE